MDLLSLLIGGVAVVFGVAALLARRSRNPNTLRKLAAMRESYGEKAGSVIHAVVYTVLPIALGLLIITASLCRRR